MGTFVWMLAGLSLKVTNDWSFIRIMRGTRRWFSNLWAETAAGLGLFQVKMVRKVVKATVFSHLQDCLYMRKETHSHLTSNRKKKKVQMLQVFQAEQPTRPGSSMSWHHKHVLCVVCATIKLLYPNSVAQDWELQAAHAATHGSDTLVHVHRQLVLLLSDCSSSTVSMTTVPAISTLVSEHLYSVYLFILISVGSDYTHTHAQSHKHTHTCLLKLSITAVAQLHSTKLSPS